MNKAFLVCSLLSSLYMMASSAEGGTIRVINENKKNLKIRIQAEGETLREDIRFYAQVIPAEYHYSFTVTAEKLHGKSFYSIKGDTNPFSLGDSCKHLSVDKNYRITFLNDMAGTTCVAEMVNQ
ncbi:MAG: hypothetical protein ACTHJ4_04340 [Candidatus Nucleicultricaceae bacterium]